ncbi:MAG: MFS transporter, partial [Spirochaetales bacterium]|nr:MFS transporter [Spirochaetales bacterium]
MSSDILNNKLSRKVKLAYGSTGFAGMITFNLFLTYSLWFFTEVVGFTATFAGTVIGLGTLWDAITDPLIGAWSDNTKNKKGRRRPFMLGVMFPFAAVTILLFTNLDFGALGTKIYFIIIVLAFYTVQTLLDVPYTALGAEMTLDYDERSSLNSYRTMFANFASVLGAFGIFLAIYFEGMTGSETLGWSLMAAVFGILALISIFIGWKYTAGYERFQDTEITHFSFKEVINGPLKNKSFIIVAIIFALGVMAQTITDGASIYYFFYNMELTEDNVSFLYAALWTAGMVWVPVIEKLSTKY